MSYTREACILRGMASTWQTLTRQSAAARTCRRMLEIARKAIPNKESVNLEQHNKNKIQKML
ncbi:MULTISPECIES: hypothetical protein [unclassified Janthinobacterium]|uniref:hypothetical protein n=1 Tax=unclassified Janthinobacterium TaxID=2610881 RepID=UPI00110D4223|nr:MULTISPECIES: hypothetical protein [unclassified Janthinobacterium]TSD74199.1 hypothetical protein FFI39_026405 [Janthinobacterium sp. KBS0711]